MHHSLQGTQSLSRVLAIFGLSLAFIVVYTMPAFAATNDPDNDGLSTKVEKNVTETSPRDADTDNDKIRDGLEDEDGDTFQDGDEDDADEDDDCDGMEDEFDADDDNDGELDADDEDDDDGEDD